MEKEVKAIKAAYEGATTIQKLRWDEGERSLSFVLTGGKPVQTRFQFFVPCGYPEDKSEDERPTLMQEDGSYEDIVDKVNAFSAKGESLTNTLDFLLKTWKGKFSLKASREPSAMKISGDSKKMKQSSGGKSDDEGSDNDSEEHESSYDDSDAMSDDGGDGDMGLGGNAKIRELIDEADHYFSKGTAKYFPELQLVRLFVDTSFIPPATAGALGVDCTIPINITIHFAEDYFDNSAPPKFEADQKPNNDAFSLQFQVTEILRHWLATNWGKTVYDTAVTPTHASSASSSSSDSGSRSGGGFLSSIKSALGGGGGGKGKEVPKQEEEYAPAKKYPKQLKELLELGFDKNLACYALHHTSGKTEEAVNLCLDPQPWFLEEAEKASQLEAKQASGHGGLKRSKRMLSQSQAGKARTNFFIALILYLKSRIGNCSNFCPICDARHECEGVKPIVCSKPDCIWRYEELGLGANVNSEIARAPEVVDLMISLAVSAVESARSEDVFSPFPSDFLDPQTKNKDIPRLKTALNGLPPLSDLRGTTEIRATLDAMDPNPVGNKVYYRLVRWLLVSNRAHLIRLSEEQQFKEMATPYQYMLLMSNPEKEARFSALKKKHGSFLAFHGSPLENWHSIMRNGLRNMSNTKGMLHGAAHGAGIYLAPNAGTSQGYMRIGNGWAKSMFGTSAGCLAMCEVIDHESVYGRDHSQWCYVVKEDDHVLTRFFFIYAGSSSGTFPSSVNARQLQIPDVSDAFKIKI